ncbi:hypothetical protein E3O53_08025 [Cryobacterium sp. TMT2-18-3]|uniref:hypothetical protein n=1 Tax=unclassified Cryobacterium TaxID=2649013 RepID=UPI001069FBDB|nr:MULTISPECIES: hypothetical protein [unclassified Cryobacterium]TFC26405.1 hypothetical protein E3O22_12280 [Cryobacterium sp. TMT2-18-2]TFC64416.1 hypothetical protein E3O53_08025 [Cryobacterium sp. TMT2-18-3]
MGATRVSSQFRALMGGEAQDLNRLRDRVAEVVAMSGHSDTRTRHEQIDWITEAALRAVAGIHPDSHEMAELAVALLDLEQAEEWERWYS